MFAMIDEERAFDILQLKQSASADEIVARCEALKSQYRKIKDETNDLKTQLDCQLKQIELDDVLIYLKRNRRI